MNRMPNVRDTVRMSEASGAIEAAGHVGAVVLTWRDTEKTARCVSELIRSPLLTNIVAVDNESDGSLESALPSDARIRIIQHRLNIGFAAGVNSGIRDLLSHPNVESVLVINNDAVLSAESLARLVAALNDDTSLSMVGPKNLTPQGELISSGGVINRWTWNMDERSRRGDIDFLTWACVLVRASAFRQIGLLDERFFMYWEDVDFGLRMKQASLRFAVVPSAHLIHEVASSHARAGTRVTAYETASFRYFLHLHAGGRIWIGVLRLWARLARSLLSGDGCRARYITEGWRLGRTVTGPAYIAFEGLR